MNNKLSLKAAIAGQIDAELNIALCKWLGWKPHSELDYGWCAPHQTTAPLVADMLPLPDYINSLESLGLIHEAEKQLTGKQQVSYVFHLNEGWSLGSVEPAEVFALIHTTARQRVIALLKIFQPELFEP